MAPPSVPRTRAHWLLLALAPACVLALVVLGTVVTPSPAGHGTHTQLGLPPCLSMQWLDLPCPGCGVTTSIALAARGKWLAALETQPFGLLVAIALAAYPLFVLWHSLRGSDLYRAASRWPAKPWLFGLGAAILLAWIYKLARH